MGGTTMGSLEDKCSIRRMQKPGNEMTNENPRLFVDMDGTIAEFQVISQLEKLYEKGYFLKLKPIENVLDAIKMIIRENPEIEVYVISSVLSDSKYALEEKNKWLDKYLPEIDPAHRIFPPCGEDKKNYVIGGVRKTDFLLDDYTKNLILWQPPAKAIKLLNGINHTIGTWKGNRVSFEKSPQRLASDIRLIVKQNLHIYDERPNQQKQGKRTVINKTR